MVVLYAVRIIASFPTNETVFPLLIISFFRGFLGFVVYGTAIIIVPGDEPVDPNGQVDWVGACLGVCALILFNFVWK